MIFNEELELVRLICKSLMKLYNLIFSFLYSSSKDQNPKSSSYTVRNIKKSMLRFHQNDKSDLSNHT